MGEAENSGPAGRHGPLTAVVLNCPDCGMKQTLMEQPWAFCHCAREDGNMWKLHGDHYDPVRVEGVIPADFKIGLSGTEFGPIGEYTRSVQPNDDPVTAKDLRLIMLRLGLIKPTWRERLALRIARIAVWLCRKIDPS